MRARRCGLGDRCVRRGPGAARLLGRLGPLLAGELVNLLTLAAEIGGVAIALQLCRASRTGRSSFAVLVLGVVLWLMPFEWIERVFGYCGLALLVFVVAAFKLNPDWGAVAHGFVPSTGSGNGWVYAYFVVGLPGRR